jgi:hypothetical protein
MRSRSATTRSFLALRFFNHALKRRLNPRTETTVVLGCQFLNSRAQFGRYPDLDGFGT